jgi:type II secretory ATPase GspE/PulE/Tfp pilus assembly ATPase PilB-like protein
MATAANQMIERGNALFEQGDYNGAFELLIQAYGQGAKNIDILNRIVDCLEYLQMPQEIADFLNQSLSEDSYAGQDRAQLYYRLGLAYAQQDKYNLARLTLLQIKELDPDFPELEKRLQELKRGKKTQQSRFDLLLEKGDLGREQIDEVMQKAHDEQRLPEEILLSEYGLDKESLGESLSVYYNAPFIQFDEAIDPPLNILEKRNLRPDFLKQNNWVPLAQSGSNVDVLMVNPDDLGKLDEIRFILGTSDINPKVVLKSDLDAFIDRFFRELHGEDQLASFDEEVESSSEEAEEHDAFSLEETLGENDSKVVKLVNSVLVEAWRRGASDIHIEPDPNAKNCTIRFREDGTCYEFTKLKNSLTRPIVSRLKIMAKLDIAERRLPQDGKIKLKLPKMNQTMELRVATMPTIDNQEDVVLRLLASGEPLPLESLGLGEEILERFKRMIYQPYGLILVVGPTGSGKTTTLHSAIRYINTSDKKIWTAEDPVEITQRGLRQVQVNPKIGLDFAASLRSFLRADPDVIMVGEMRDYETAHIGIEASLTGHLLFSTLHTNSAPETVTRLLDMDLDPFNFSDSLLCVLAQRLVKTLCSRCKEAYTPSQEELEELRTEFGDTWERWFDQSFLMHPRLYRPVGCNRCVGGYKGRIGIYEMMSNTEDLKRLIKRKSPTEELKAQARQDGMLTLKQDGILKVVQGITDIHQIRKVAGS